MDGIILGDWPVNKLGPSEVFEQTNLDTTGMVSLLDEKLLALAPSNGMTKTVFKGWLLALRDFASVIIFHGGELAARYPEPLTVLIIPSAPDGKGMLELAYRGTYPGIMDVGVVNFAEFMPLLMPREGGSSLRPFLSSELLVLGARQDIEMLEMVFRELRSAFETEPLDDLVRLVTMDVKRAVFRGAPDGVGIGKGCSGVLMEETDFTGRNPLLKKVIEAAEFDRIAFKAMAKRRIPPGMGAYILPQVKARAGCGN